MAVNDESQHFYIYRNRAIGKSSIASYLMEYANVKYNMLGIHI